MKRNNNRPVAIAVEGVDFLHFVRNRIMENPEYQHVWLHDFKDKGFTLSRWLKGFSAQDGFEQLDALGIIRDKEEDGIAMAESVRQSIADVGCVVPKDSGEIQHGSPSIAYLLVPTDEPSGCLEHAMLDAVQDADALICAQEFLSCIDRELPSSNWKAKALVRSIMAVSDDPDRKLGETALKGLWDWDHPSLKSILQFIKKLNDYADSK